MLRLLIIHMTNIIYPPLLFPDPIPPSSFLGAARAQNFPRFPSLPFPQLFSPLPLPPLISIYRPSSPTSFLPFALHKIYTWPVSFHFTKTKKCVFQSLNNIMNNDKRPESLITCTWVSSTTIVGVSARKNMVEDNMYTCTNQGSSNTVQRLHQGKVEKAKRLRGQGCHPWRRIGPNTPPPPFLP